MLHSIDGLKDLNALENECMVTHNESLCISEIFDVCGDLEIGGDRGNTQNNRLGC